ncbi:hypothetical protein [Marinobacter qingdaonensis]|uniref:Cytochrome oxidase Cu insertion factor, SCO1/SenC/PrrC family n=1 Tax=Marinobacter qingdaonensis TaxID=3108486 RepID=A0ABU5NWP5_9GAMM|nr:hypothetical protein [Marinobacter sp. ASW11-75]MEA1080147.1 hypothetical protein [Marinobacter sp. ASW11-75]
MTMTMANRISDPDNGPSPEQIRRGRRTAILLFVIGFGPMVFATIMFYTGWLNPSGHTNNGELISPVVPVQQLQLETRDGTPLAERFGPEQADSQWLLMVVADDCAGPCQELLYLARQVNIALGKNANRVARAAALGSVPAELSERWSTEYNLMERLVPAPGTTPAWPAGIDPEAEPRILLVDPFGNVMMHYGTDHTGKDMLKDLKHLLKISQIG